MTKGRKVKENPRMVIVGDSPTCRTGFGVVVTNLMEHFNKEYDMYTLGVNYYGDYHPATDKYKIWPAANNNDVYGISKLFAFLQQVKPEVLFIVNDPWVVVEYVKTIKKYRKLIEENPQDYPQFKAFAYMPVDAENVKIQFVVPLNEAFDEVITYTEFAREELVLSGMQKPIHVIPHGVDTRAFYPMDKREAKQLLGIPVDNFVVLTVARNSPRKRLDLTIEAFAKFVKDNNLPKSVRWYYHGALQDVGYDIIQLCMYFGVADRLILSSETLTPDTPLPERHMQVMYNSADVFFGTPTGEGWMLPLAEAMACKTAGLVPDHSALSEWPNGGVEYFATEGNFVSTNGLNTVHKLPSVSDAAKKLMLLYDNTAHRYDMAQKGYELISQDIFKWTNIARDFMNVFQGKS